jgi:hypothetical protein
MKMILSICMFLGCILLLLIGVLSVLRDLLARSGYSEELPSDATDRIDQRVDLPVESLRSQVERNPR